MGADVGAKRVAWVRARQDFVMLFEILDNLRIDEGRRFGIVYPDADEDNCDIEEDMGQMSTGVKILLPMSHNTLTIAEEYIK